MGREPVDPVDVRLGLLRALTAAAETSPLVLLLDDVDRLDPASVAALAFVLGRLGVDPIGTIATTGPGEGPLDAVTTDVLPLAALAPQALAEIVQGSVPCAPDVAATVAAWAEGSPLVALELARSLSADERDGSARLPDAPRPTVLVVDRLQKELDGLPADVQRALVVAAADRTGRLAPISAALAALGEVDGSLDRAEAAGLIVIDGDTVRFRHALLRPLAYRLVAAASRRAAHRALAASLTEPHEATERAWQLVSSSAAPDEEVAGLLELVAEAERRRGAPTAAATALEHAARLTPAAADRTRRLVAAALDHVDALDLDAAHRTARSASAGGDPEARLALLEVVELRDGAAAALGLEPANAAVRADLHLSAGQPDLARAALRDARGGGGRLGDALRAHLDPSAPLPPEPTGDSPLDRRARRRWLAAAGERGVAVPSPSTVDELVAAAVALSRSGDLAEASDLLGRAAALVPAACERLAGHVAAVAARLGEGSAPVDALAAALSAAELRVAEAVASGLTNRQAADRLFLSAKTVDFHLQSIYRKLAIRSRAELATQVATRGRTA
jgi:DNA-binding NarL/FixJ family response regulator